MWLVFNLHSNYYILIICPLLSLSKVPGVEEFQIGLGWKSSQGGRVPNSLGVAFLIIASGWKISQCGKRLGVEKFPHPKYIGKYMLHPPMITLKLSSALILQSFPYFPCRVSNP